MKNKFYFFFSRIFLIIIFSLPFLFSPVFVSAQESVVINEFLPNPVGVDKEGEFIELKNLSSEEIDLVGWRLMDKSGKTFILKKEKIEGGGFLSLSSQLTKISINNSDEKISLFAPTGELVFEINFSGSAKEGYSFSRFAENDWRLTSVVTPGKENYFSVSKKNDTDEERDVKQNDFDISSTSDSLNDDKINLDAADDIDPASQNNVPIPNNVILLALGLGLSVALVGIFFIRKFLKEEN